jgi:membrane protein implicated in regulation of membrane protease activity
MMSSDGSEPARTLTSGGLAARIAAFMIVGIPLLAFVWEMLNELGAGIWNTRHVLLAIPAILLLLFLWRVMSRAVQRWDETLPSGTHSNPQQ